MDASASSSGYWPTEPTNAGIGWRAEHPGSQPAEPPFARKPCRKRRKAFVSSPGANGAWPSMQKRPLAAQRLEAPYAWVSLSVLPAESSE